MSKFDDIEIINRVIHGYIEAYSHIINKYQGRTEKCQMLVNADDQGGAQKHHAKKAPEKYQPF